jgi:hypothetical protein
MNTKQIMIVVFILAAFQLGCSGLDVTRSQAEVEALQKIRSGQYELIRSDELAQLRKDAEIGRSVGRYQMHQMGFRAWRLDTATGTSCLLLTTDADWKKPEIQAQACPSY